MRINLSAKVRSESISGRGGEKKVWKEITFVKLEIVKCHLLAEEPEHFITKNVSYIELSIQLYILSTRKTIVPLLLIICHKRMKRMYHSAKL